MKKYLLLLSVVVLGLSACKKVDFVAEQAAIDEAKIQAYISANNITVTKDPSGIYYQILKTGTGAYPTATSTIQVGYTGKLLNGTTFEASSSAVLPLFVLASASAPDSKSNSTEVLFPAIVSLCKKV